MSKEYAILSEGYLFPAAEEDLIRLRKAFPIFVREVGEWEPEENVSEES